MTTVKKVDLVAYAKQYDNMARYKPSYHEVMQVVMDEINLHLDNDGEMIIGDFGAGTGELSIRLANKFPKAIIHAVELNDGFYKKLVEKTNSYTNVKVYHSDIERLNFDHSYFHAITMIHVLNYTAHAREGIAIERAYEQLRTNGVLVIADIGRELNLKAHAKETISACIKEIGIIKTALLYLRSRQVIKQNKTFIENQKKGIHPLHNLDDFVSMIESFGFSVLMKRNDLYLGDDDFVVAIKQ